jgi:hypothetical protein
MISLMENYHQYNRAAIAEKAMALYNYDSVGKAFFNIYNNYI